MILRIEPVAASGSLDLFGQAGEFVATIAGLRRTSDVLRCTPDLVWLELYAYELLERCREAAELDSESVSAPLWPGCVLAAAECSVSCWAELEQMLPEFSHVVLTMPTIEEVDAAALRVLGEQRFDPAVYLAALRFHADQASWVVR